MIEEAFEEAGMGRSGDGDDDDEYEEFYDSAPCNGIIDEAFTGKVRRIARENSFPPLISHLHSFRQNGGMATPGATSVSSAACAGGTALSLSCAPR